MLSDPTELARRASGLFDRRRGIVACDGPSGSPAVWFTPELAAGTSGVVLPPKALRTAAARRVTHPAALRRAGILVGVRADTGDEPVGYRGRGSVTSGLDGLSERLERLRGAGADFAVWSVCTALGGAYALRTLTVNSQAAARFAACCQDVGVVPVVRVGTRMAPASPEHRRMALASALLSVVGHVQDLDVDLSATVIVTTTEAAPTDPSEAGLLATLPPGLGGVALCPAEPPSGDDGDVLATIRAVLRSAPPWPVTFYLDHAAAGHALADQETVRTRLARARDALTAGRHLRVATAEAGRPGLA
jgi:fructose-bisphosphate aldolase, class I